MSIELAGAVAFAVYLYLAAGAAFAVAVLPRLALRIDPGLEGAPLAVRVLIAPGTVLLWPLLLWRWFLAGPHRRKAA